MQNTTLTISITVAKTCEKVLRLTMTSRTKVKVDNFHLYLKKIIDFNFVGHKDLSTLESDIHLGHVASVNITFSGR